MEVVHRPGLGEREGCARIQQVEVHLRRGDASALDDAPDRAGLPERRDAEVTDQAARL